MKLPTVPSGQSEADIREIVRRERAVELAFEGLRLADIRRWRIAETVLPGNIYGITYEDNDSSVKVVQQMKIQTDEKIKLPFDGINGADRFFV